jgi:hypothetical protein
LKGRKRGKKEERRRKGEGKKKGREKGKTGSFFQFIYLQHLIYTDVDCHSLLYSHH